MLSKDNDSSVITLQTEIQRLTASACNLPIEAIDIEQPIIELGINSLIAASLNLELEKKIGVELPFAEIANGASIKEIAQYIQQEQEKKGHNFEESPTILEPLSPSPPLSLDSLESGFYDIKRLPQYKKIVIQKSLFKRAQIELPFYRSFDSPSTNTIQFGDQQLINFASYNYLGYTHDPRVNAAAQHAITQFGTSASSSRIVSGEKSIHRDLELALSQLYEVDDALIFVSGYATNISVISHLMDKNDLIIHDSLAHNSIVMGSTFSKAKRLKFPHNNLAALETLLKENRVLYGRVLIVVEGLYSMDGDTAPLAALIALKKHYKCLLMVDEAHSIGVLGKRGFGSREHCQIAATDVDIWMGTLSKSFAGCGGYIAGCSELIDYLRFTLPSLIFSVGLAPPLAGASLKAIELLIEDQHRVQMLQENSQYFLSLAKQKGFNTGLAEGYAIVPILLGHSLKTAKLANTLFHHGVNVQPIIYPGVEDAAARLRFFISALHTPDQIDFSLNLLEQYHFEPIGTEHEYYDTTC